MNLEINYNGNIIKSRATEYNAAAFVKSTTNKNNDPFYGFRNVNIMSALCRVATYVVEAGEDDPRWLLDVEKWLENTGRDNYFPTSLSVTYHNTTISIKPTSVEDEDLINEYVEYINQWREK